MTTFGMQKRAVKQARAAEGAETFKAATVAWHNAKHTFVSPKARRKCIDHAVRCDMAYTDRLLVTNPSSLSRKEWMELRYD